MASEKLNEKALSGNISSTDILLVANPTTGKMYKCYASQIKDYLKTGDVSALLTADKSNIVAAVNEIDNGLSSLAADNTTIAIYKVSNFATL